MFGKRDLVLMRGLPGSGKSTKARRIAQEAFQKHGIDSYTISADHFFEMKSYADNIVYLYDRNEISHAHSYCKWRCKTLMKNNAELIIVDNTNTAVWEMNSYVQFAKENNYTVHFVEPDTSWKFDVAECFKRNTHGVPLEKLQEFSDRFVRNISLSNFK